MQREMKEKLSNNRGLVQVVTVSKGICIIFIGEKGREGMTWRDKDWG
jgi:hypothetical protein